VAGRLDGVEASLGDGCEDADELTVGLIGAAEPGTQLGQAGRQLPLLEGRAVAQLSLPAPLSAG
jgi:hypothetical protein